MTKKSKGRKRLVREPEEDVKPDIPIANLPKNFLWMRVNSGTKIRNVLNYALKEFPSYKSVVWSGAGQGIGKVITCAEICKKQNLGLHQLTKLRYIESKNVDTDKKNKDNRRVPEIHILLSKDSLDSAEPGHQLAADDDRGLFRSRKLKEDKNLSSPKNEKLENQSVTEESDRQQLVKQEASTSMKLSHVATEEFAAMGLRTAKKRSHKSQSEIEITSATENTSSGNKSRKKEKKN